MLTWQCHVHGFEKWIFPISTGRAGEVVPVYSVSPPPANAVFLQPLNLIETCIIPMSSEQRMWEYYTTLLNTVNKKSLNLVKPLYNSVHGRDLKHIGKCCSIPVTSGVMAAVTQYRTDSSQCTMWCSPSH